MPQQVPLDSSAEAAPDAGNDGLHEVRPDVAYQRVVLVNVIYVGPKDAGDRGWVLVDAGLMGTESVIADAAARRFGVDARPAAIVLTHGHFDHVGALAALAERYDAPVYAHDLESPYLDGSASYPPPDPGVGGGMMSTLSRFYPSGPVDVAARLVKLPADGTVPPMPGWHWVHAPGHTPGQVALWRESDRTLLAADAFVTTAQESAYAVALQKPEMHGPPKYFTQDWAAARESVRALSDLAPDAVVTGHGPAMQGPQMLAALETLARDFDAVAVPADGQYVAEPATAEAGTAYVGKDGSKTP